MIIFGLGAQTAHSILSTIVHDVLAGKRYPAPGEYDGILRHGKRAFRSVHKSQHEIYLGDAMERVRKRGEAGSLTAVQVFWTDTKGAFPYQADCDPNVTDLQPRLNLQLGEADMDGFVSQFGDLD